MLLLVVVPSKKYVEDIPGVQGKVHANFGLHVCIRPVVWKENEDKQTDRQTDTPFCVTIIDKLGGGFGHVPPQNHTPCMAIHKGLF